jgi:hypothetical protein
MKIRNQFLQEVSFSRSGLQAMNSAIVELKMGLAPQRFMALSYCD